MPGIEGLPLGNQIWADTDLKETYDVIGKTGHRRKDGFEKFSGRAIYNRDYIVPGMLYGKYMTSPMPMPRYWKWTRPKPKRLPG
jgi:CO/xanthine dehydrogenase Mo-binding subunit